MLQKRPLNQYEYISRHVRVTRSTLYCCFLCHNGYTISLSIICSIYAVFKLNEITSVISWDHKLFDIEYDATKQLCKIHMLIEFELHHSFVVFNIIDNHGYNRQSWRGVPMVPKLGDILNSPANGGFISSIMLFVFLPNAWKPDMTLVSTDHK